jgi:hypothetical protein
VRPWRWLAWIFTRWRRPMPAYWTWSRDAGAWFHEMTPDEIREEQAAIMARRQPPPWLERTR